MHFYVPSQTTAFDGPVDNSSSAREDKRLKPKIMADGHLPRIEVMT